MNGTSIDILQTGTPSKDDLLLYSIIRDYPYENWFRETHYNGKELNDLEKKEYLELAERTISMYSESLPLLKGYLVDNQGIHDDFHEIQRIVVSVLLFATITMLDCMVISKYYILADKDYDKRFMRGKMKVILNEGFKKLYGFEKSSKKNSEWAKLQPIMERFPKIIQQQYDKLTNLLEEQSQKDSWWKDERNVETHLDAEKLYDSRCEELIESKVMMDSMRLFDALFAVYHFLSNMHGCLQNYLVTEYNRRVLNRINNREYNN